MADMLILEDAHSFRLKIRHFTSLFGTRCPNDLKTGECFSAYLLKRLTKLLKQQQSIT